MPDTVKAKKMLEDAMRHLPQGNAYSSARIHIKRAISEMFHQEQKQVKSSPSPWPNWQMNSQTGQLLSPTEMALHRKGITNAMSMLDEMYSQEERKLQDMDKQTRHDEEQDDNNHVGPILG